MAQIIPHLGLFIWGLQDVAVVVDVPLLPVLHVLHPKSIAVKLSFDVQEGV